MEVFRAAAKPSLLNDLGSSHLRILFADAKMLEHHMADIQADGFDARQLCTIQAVAVTARDGVDGLVGGAVPLDDPLERSGPKLGGFCGARSGSSNGLSAESLRSGGRTGRSTKLSPVKRLTVTGCGAGQTMGQ